MSDGLQDVFTAEEVARAAALPVWTVHSLVSAAEVHYIAGTHFLTGDEARRALRLLRRGVSALPGADAFVHTAPEPLFARIADKSRFADRRHGVHTACSSAVHAVLLLALIWWTSGSTDTAALVAASEPTRMVFVVAPGPGGGGGGGGLRNPLPPRRVERPGPPRPAVQVPRATPERVLASRRVVDEPPRPVPQPAAVPQPVEPAPEPLPSRVLVAPVAATASSDREREGVIEQPRQAADSQGSGAGGGAGSGQGLGNGEGLGGGIGEGAGGGTGGGPFRPGSGIEPPRLLHEVKAQYTDEARRRGITGDVVLEIVVRRDGTVGDITILQGRGAGLDQRAVAAVRQWRFSPARRRGEPVDVIVEVAVEFTLR